MQRAVTSRPQGNMSPPARWRLPAALAAFLLAGSVTSLVFPRPAAFGVARTAPIGMTMMADEEKSNALSLAKPVIPTRARPTRPGGRGGGGGRGDQGGRGPQNQQGGRGYNSAGRGQKGNPRRPGGSRPQGGRGSAGRGDGPPMLQLCNPLKVQRIKVEAPPQAPKTKPHSAPWDVRWRSTGPTSPGAVPEYRWSEILALATYSP